MPCCACAARRAARDRRPRRRRDVHRLLVPRARGAPDLDPRLAGGRRATSASRTRAPTAARCRRASTRGRGKQQLSGLRFMTPPGTVVAGYRVHLTATTGYPAGLEAGLATGSLLGTPDVTQGCTGEGNCTFGDPSEPLGDANLVTSGRASRARDRPRRRVPHLAARPRRLLRRVAERRARGGAHLAQRDRPARRRGAAARRGERSAARARRRHGPCRDLRRHERRGRRRRRGRAADRRDRGRAHAPGRLLRPAVRHRRAVPGDAARDVRGRHAQADRRRAHRAARGHRRGRPDHDGEQLAFSSSNPRRPIPGRRRWWRRRRNERRRRRWNHHDDRRPRARARPDRPREAALHAAGARGDDHRRRAAHRRHARGGRPARAAQRAVRHRRAGLPHGAHAAHRRLRRLLRAGREPARAASSSR